MEKRHIEIVPGNGDINISPAEDHINDIVEKKEKPKKEDIVIPKTRNEEGKE